MGDFQKALLRFLYIVLVVSVALTAWMMFRPVQKDATAPIGWDTYGRMPGVTASGTCIVRTKPEFAEVTIGVYQSQTTAKAAKDYVKTTCAKILSALTTAGVSSKDIKTQRFQLQSQVVSSRAGDTKKWNCEESFRVRIRDLDKVAEIVDSAVQVGANRVGGLVYSVEDVSKIRAAGRGKAAEAARKKAAELAKALGGRLGRLIACSEGYPHEYGGYGNYYYEMPSIPRAQVSVDLQQPGGAPEEAEEVTIQPGDLVTTVVVTATYSVE